MKNTNMNRIPTNGNRKSVRDITNNIRYGSFTEAAMAKGVAIASVSYAVNKGKMCKGCRLVLESELYKNSDLLCEEIAKANAREAKANERAKAKLAKMHELEAKAAAYDRLMAEQEAARKAEEERLETERKAEEKRQAKIAKLTGKISRLNRLLDRTEAKMNKMYNERTKFEMELEELLDNGKEVE